MLIDTHCHLTDERLSGVIEEIVGGLSDGGLECVIDVGNNFKTSVSAVANAEKYDRVYAAVGIHPHDAKDRRLSDYDEFRTLAKSEKVVAIGEIGLDYFYDLSDRDVQKRVLIEQLELADELSLPVSFHLRDAYDDFYKIISEHKSLLKHGAVVHCYSGTAEYIGQIEKFGFYYGFDGPLTFKNARRSVEALRAAPVDRIVFETDSPYLTPEPKRGQTNYPNNVAYVAKKAADILDMDYEKIVDISTNNARRLFKKLKWTY